MRTYILPALMGFVLGCGCSKSAEPPPPSARVRIDGSTTMNAALKELATRYMAAHPGVQVEVTHSSSGGGIRKLIAETVEIAASARAPLDDDHAEARKRGIALKSYQIAYDALAIIVAPATAEHLGGMTFEQARAIFFEGTITEWSHFDPELSGPINVYARDPALSGASAVFVEHITGREDARYVSRATYLDSTFDLVPAVAADAHGIAAVPVSFIDERVRGLATGADAEHFVMPGMATVRSLHYPLRRDLFLVTRGTPAGASSALIRFALGDEGQTLLNAQGLISLR